MSEQIIRSGGNASAFWTPWGPVQVGPQDKLADFRRRAKERLARRRAARLLKEQREQGRAK